MAQCVVTEMLGPIVVRPPPGVPTVHPASASTAPSVQIGTVQRTALCTPVLPPSTPQPDPSLPDCRAPPVELCEIARLWRLWSGPTSVTGCGSAGSPPGCP